MCRYDLTDEEYSAIRKLLPANKKRRGRPWIDHRLVINAIIWILRTGSPWRDLPAQFGKWQTAYNRFRRWQVEGLWDRIYEHLLNRIDKDGKIDRSAWCVDGTIVRCHRSAAGYQKNTQKNEEINALGRSKGGFTTKLHVLTDAQGVLLSVTLTGGQQHEAKEFKTLLNNCMLSLHRQSSRPNCIIGDKGYNSKEIRELIRSRGICPQVPTRSNQRSDPQFDSVKYKGRNIIERTIGWLKNARRIATRYDKLATSYLTFIKLAAIRNVIKLI